MPRHAVQFGNNDLGMNFCAVEQNLETLGTAKERGPGPKKLLAKWMPKAQEHRSAPMCSGISKKNTP
jgi:hypothetical protein